MKFFSNNYHSIPSEETNGAIVPRSCISEAIARTIYYTQIATDIASFIIYAPIVSYLMQTEWVFQNIQHLLLPLLGVSVTFLLGMGFSDHKAKRAGYSNTSGNIAFQIVSGLCQGGLFYAFAFAAMLVYYQSTGIVLSAGKYLTFNVYIISAMMMIVAQFDNHRTNQTKWMQFMSMLCMTITTYLTIFIIPAYLSVFDHLDVNATCGIIVYNSFLAMAMSYGCDMDVERYMKQLGDDVHDITEDDVRLALLVQLNSRMECEDYGSEETMGLLAHEKC